MSDCCSYGAFLHFGLVHRSHMDVYSGSGTRRASAGTLVLHWAPARGESRGATYAAQRLAARRAAAPGYAARCAAGACGLVASAVEPRRTRGRAPPPPPAPVSISAVALRARAPHLVHRAPMTAQQRPSRRPSRVPADGPAASEPTAQLAAASEPRRRRRRRIDGHNISVT
jgi:hypothetical protein